MDLVTRMPGLAVIAGDERIDGTTRLVRHGDQVTIGGMRVRCLFTPCHTTGHICYYVTQAEDKLVFTGDTLFLGGCGRFFEGSAEQMTEALVTILGHLPGQTKVSAAHAQSRGHVMSCHVMSSGVLWSRILPTKP